MPSNEMTLESVKDYYGKVLHTSKDLKTSACTASGRPHPVVAKVIRSIPKEVREKFYGCGAPLPLGIEGRSVLDLGSGSGRDCYAAAALVGPTGSVVGIDMTAEQLAVARAHADQYCKSLGYDHCNLKFVEGYIERLEEAGIEANTFDLVISNCVVNLSPDKPRVLREVYRVLKQGGEFYFSDVYCDRRLPKHVQEHQVLWGECIAGALYTNDFIRYARQAGFGDPRILSSAPIEVHDPELKAVVGEAKFFSITYRLFKLPEGMLETLCEDYGQAVRYKGTIKGMEYSYMLDDHHLFEKGKLSLVCGNTAGMLGENGVSWLAPHFEIIGDRSVHYGEFPCGPAPAIKQAEAAADPPGGGCCSGGGCC